jgi:hypothetical protein
MPGDWSEFERRRAPPSLPGSSELRRLCALVFTLGPGRELLRHLHETYVDQVLPPNTSPERLRELNAQRGLISMLERETEAGSRPPDKPAA